ncbi:GntR family transcriptional regulator [Granulosicoccus antarcticus]|uniref:Putative D-xylose utilization operon transcriptional repressor n=1 Tax=Granulosicoccus antarcticus IMCC3135 TaxID=1192854 RepID=A0A2Z2NZI7_9GAMM|nr:GntR family transcriptional regulator [Granulosicoccus antarcticus]ASJ75351.1 putative D-xylose utilization operon transcriptional repressor [Granulosicoccus antarcticus IMCC3135]
MRNLSTQDQPAAFYNVYQHLRKDILAGDLLGGAVLRQDDIALQYGVSKVPVREALRRLEMEGLVEFRPRRGAIVKQVTDSDLLEMLDIRIALECRALELAIPNFADSDFDLAQDVLDEYALTTDKERWSELNQRFHGCILEPCGNHQLLALINDFEQRVGPLVRLRVTETAGLERPMKEHAEILELCKARAAEPAIKALRAHIETTHREVAAAIRRNANKGP